MIKKIKEFFRFLNEGEELKIFLIMIFSFTIAFGAGTQYLVKILNYHKALGKPIIGNIYNPFLIVKLLKYYNSPLRNKLDQATYITSTILMVLGIIIASMAIHRKKMSTHGTARWITFKELKKAKLVSKKGFYTDGVILGRVKKFGLIAYTVIENMATHILIIAPSRSGKGTGILIPTLLNWLGSVIVFDIKGENYAWTAGFRKKVLKQKVLRWAPDKLDNSISINPLSEIRIGTGYEFLDTETIMNVIADPGEGKEQTYWEKEASTFLIGIALHVLYQKKYEEGRVASFGDIVDFLTSVDKPLDDKLLEIKDYKHMKNSALFEKIYEPEQLKGIEEGTHPLVARTIAQILNKAGEERAGVISTALSFLNIFKDPVIRKNTRETNIKIWDLMNYKVPVSLYIVAEVKTLMTLAPLIRLLMTQVVGTLCPEMDFESEKPTHKHKMLLMMDEFPAMGKIPIIEKGLGFFAGYGIKTLIVAQAIGQITKLYGEKNGILENCVTNVFYSPVPADKDTPKMISDLLGSTTIKVKNFSARAGAVFNGNISSNNHARNLLTPEEVRNKLGEKRNIISISGMYPIWGYKIKYYEEDYFMKKTKKIYKIPKTDRIIY